MDILKCYLKQKWWLKWYILIHNFKIIKFVVPTNDFWENRLWQLTRVLLRDPKKTVCKVLIIIWSWTCKVKCSFEVFLHALSIANVFITENLNCKLYFWSTYNNYLYIRYILMRQYKFSDWEPMINELLFWSWKNLVIFELHSKLSLFLWEICAFAQATLAMGCYTFVVINDEYWVNYYEECTTRKLLHI